MNDGQPLVAAATRVGEYANMDHPPDPSEYLGVTGASGITTHGKPR